MFTTWGASAVAGLPSGSRTHWKAAWIAVAVAVPVSLKILAAIHVAPGRHPDRRPAGVPADDDPIVAVPWPVRSVGRRRVLAVRVEPGVRAAPPAAGEVRVADVDAGVEVGDDDALPGVPEVPQGRRVDERDVRLGRGRRTWRAVGRPGGPAAAAGTIGISSGVTLATSARAAIAAMTCRGGRDRQAVEDPERGLPGDAAQRRLPARKAQQRDLRRRRAWRAAPG